MFLLLCLLIRYISWSILISPIPKKAVPRRWVIHFSQITPSVGGLNYHKILLMCNTLPCIFFLFLGFLLTDKVNQFLSIVFFNNNCNRNDYSAQLFSLSLNLQKIFSFFFFFVLLSSDNNDYSVDLLLYSKIHNIRDFILSTLNIVF